MKKVFKSLMGVALALVMCLTMAPTATAKADEAVALSEYTEDQLLTAFMGEWSGDQYYEAVIAKDHFKLVMTSDWYDDETIFDTDWTYEGAVELEGRALTEDDCYAEMDGLEVNTKTKALKFTTGDKVFYMYKGYVVNAGNYFIVEYTNESGDVVKAAFSNKYVDFLIIKEGEATYEITEDYVPFSSVLKAALDDVGTAEQPKEEPAEEPTPAPTETPVEEPKAEEPAEETTAPAETETPVEEPKTEEPVEETTAPVEEPKTEEPAEETTAPVETEDNKEVIEKTKDGREVYTGEQIYIVKKGDSLWAISKHFLGHGKYYTKLFTRNNGIIVKPEVIRIGQEIIIPVLK